MLMPFKILGGKVEDLKGNFNMENREITVNIA